jgi:hypothetical protein
MCSGNSNFPFTWVSPSLVFFTDLAAVAFLLPPHSTFASLRMAAVSPTAITVEIQSDPANNVTGKQLFPE